MGNFLIKMKVVALVKRILSVHGLMTFLVKILMSYKQNSKKYRFKKVKAPSHVTKNLKNSTVPSLEIIIY